MKAAPCIPPARARVCVCVYTYICEINKTYKVYLTYVCVSLLFYIFTLLYFLSFCVKNDFLLGIAKIPFTGFYFKLKGSFSQSFIEIGGDRFSELYPLYYSCNHIIQSCYSNT